MSLNQFNLAQKTTKTILWMATCVPTTTLACACGCGIFNVGLPGLPVSGVNDQLSVQYSFMNQDINHSGNNNASPLLNPDKQISTDFYTLYGQHMFNRSWGIMAMVPYWNRTFTTDLNGTPGQTDAHGGVNPNIQTAQVGALSDIRVMGMYTGFSPDQSSGITFGLKLPTGSYTTNPLLDRDTEPGTGTTDLLLGGFKIGYLGSHTGWFLQGVYRHALNSSADISGNPAYQPGDSLTATAGVTYNAHINGISVVPMLQINGQWRGHDHGGGDFQYSNANSGYTNLYLAPGMLLNLNPHWQLNVSYYTPIYRNNNGYQLVPQKLINAGATFMF